jgi:hypothetical protein
MPDEAHHDAEGRGRSRFLHPDLLLPEQDQIGEAGVAAARPYDVRASVGAAASAASEKQR